MWTVVCTCIWPCNWTVSNVVLPFNLGNGIHVNNFCTKIDSLWGMIQSFCCCSFASSSGPSVLNSADRETVYIGYKEKWVYISIALRKPRYINGEIIRMFSVDLQRVWCNFSISHLNDLNRMTKMLIIIISFEDVASTLSCNEHVILPWARSAPPPPSRLPLD